MDWQLLGLCGLTFVIQLIGTLAYAVRIAGVRTRRIAVSFALFNVLVLVSRTSNSFQGPFLAKRIELSLRSGMVAHLLADFRWLLLSATLATWRARRWCPPSSGSSAAPCSTSRRTGRSPSSCCTASPGAGCPTSATPSPSRPAPT